MKALMFLGVGAGAVGLAALSNGGGSFEYDAATPAEREVWLQEQAKGYEKSARFFLKSGGGPGAVSLYMDSVEPDARGKRIVLNIRVQVPYGKQVYFGDVTKEQEALCQKYGTGALYKNNIKVVATMKTQKGMPVTEITADPAKCDRALGRPQQA